MTGNYRTAYDQSINDPNAFWLAQADGIDWITAPT